MNSLKQSRLGKQLLQLGFAADWPVQGKLEGLPLLRRQGESSAISQGLVGSIDPGIQQELTDILVRNASCLLQQELHRRACTHIDTLRFG